jgi:transposase-like protein
VCVLNVVNHLILNHLTAERISTGVCSVKEAKTTFKTCLYCGQTYLVINTHRIHGKQYYVCRRCTEVSENARIRINKSNGMVL